MHNEITRRAFCSLILALPVPAWAQEAGKIFRIGLLDGSTAAWIYSSVRTVGAGE